MHRIETDQLKSRISKLEEQNFEGYVTLIELMSNATFFGEIKKTSCRQAKQGQCSFFTLKKEAQERLPIATKCRITECNDLSDHCHIEITNLTCSLCPRWQTIEK